MSALVLVTGFGPFLDVARNPSGEAALALAQAPPPGLEVVGVELPVSFAGAPAALEAALSGLAPRVPDVLLALGLHRGSWLRLEQRARARLGSAKPDAEGRRGAEQGLLAGGELRCRLDLEVLAQGLVAAGAADVRLSRDAGGYVCERTYHAALAAGERLGRPALFLHVPPPQHLDAPSLAALLGAWLPELVRQARARV